MLGNVGLCAVKESPQLAARSVRPRDDLTAKIDAARYDEHPMPARATIDQFAWWHVAHDRVCVPGVS
jgi:hypothetical protein